MRQYIRKADIILLIVLVIAGLASSAALAMLKTEAGSDAKVIIESGGKLYATYPLYEDRAVTVPAPGASKKSDGSYDRCNTVEIADGVVKVTEATCKNHVCVNHSVISAGGESIVCLPNRLVVRIESGGSEKGDGYDSVTS